MLDSILIDGSRAFIAVRESIRRLARAKRRGRTR
jgi:hypothetical protein